MKIVDTNVLVHTVNPQAPHHEPARRWLDGALSRGETVGFPWVTLIGFLRVATNRAVMSRPLDLDRAAKAVETWLGAPTATVVEPTTRHLSILHGLLAGAGTAANLVPDAHIAALAIEHGAEVVSFDYDFGRFPGLAWHVPS